MPFTALPPASRRLLAGRPAPGLPKSLFTLNPIQWPFCHRRWINGGTDSAKSTDNFQPKSNVKKRSRSKHIKILHFVRQQASKRKTKTRYKAPSVALVSALEKASISHATPKVVRGKVNLSHVRPDSFFKPRHRGQIHPLPEYRQAMQSLLAHYIKTVQSGSMSEADYSINPTDEYFLASKGYSLDDIKLWAKIILQKDSYAAARMLVAGSGEGVSGTKQVPFSVMLFLLRRPHISERALRLLVQHSLDRLEAERIALQKGELMTDEKTIFLLFIRLVRKAREVYPDAIVEITRLVTEYINATHVGTIRLDAAKSTIPEERMRQKIIRLTLLYNRVLTMLSLPPSIEPFASAPIMERAQFDVLRRMAVYQTPLTINQDGFRAVTRVQLSHKKSDAERTWAQLKSKSWPPWKEDRTAMDAEIGPEHGVSRAGQSISRMHEAGYPSYRWDRAMGVYAGWDEDRSPTIQKRAVFGKVPSAIVTARHEANDTKNSTSVAAEGSTNTGSYNELQAMWVARIRTTRTLEEAWACFLSYDALPIRQSQMVYEVMFEKIAFEHQREGYERRLAESGKDAEWFSGVSNALPGDGMEVWPTPESPHERLDPRLARPTIKLLLEKMKAAGISPGGKCLALVIETAPTINFAHGMLNKSKDHRRLLKAEPSHEDLIRVPNPLFRGYIALLCRLWFIEDRTPYSTSPQAPRQMIHRAIMLLDCRKFSNQPSWIAVLRAFVRQHKHHPTDDAFHLVHMTVAAMERAKVDLRIEGFQLVCQATSRHAIARERRFSDTETTDEAPSDSDASDAQQQLTAANGEDSRYLRALFIQLVGTDDPAWKPQRRAGTGALALLTTPRPSVLHDYIRALGMLRDWEGLLSAASFMAEHGARLVRHANEGGVGGERRMRLPVVALRVFLERSWEETEQVMGAPEEVVMLAREQVQRAKVLKGWASDEEVDAYSQRMKND
ncbi:uncharacterized protein K452DRAFT_316398 [Aplosporella prunicola CBS 121167]|uniref:Uncharacterized protein n=1 Tax=Aplosporella prunicola CBS 121167 TaxID=1176127 RepID=A0A6A6BLV4_9PEZI|nr:uncharacterized protein K452DRAFT_316398 [Aplosporella prunicola CBS 121167]KAF2144393.1 hypothetical protein K452DRAFT_316398 [Aplosporella prunicola CBS 121167]